MNKKWIALAVKFLVSAGLIWFLLGNVDLVEVKNQALGADPLMLTLASVFTLVQAVICVFRWRAVMVAIESVLGFMKATQIYFIGFFFNQALPSSVGGDAVRIYKAYRAGMPLSGSINGVMLERVATVLGLVALVILATPFFIGRVGEAEANWIVPAVTMLGLGGIGGLALLMVLDRLPTKYHHWRLVRGLALLAADTRRVFLTPRHAFKALGWSITGHANAAFIAYLLALSLGLDVTWVDCMVLIPPVLLVMTLPISIAGWGVREGAMVTAFGLIGVPAEGALVLSIMFGLWGLTIGLIGGGVWLLSGDRSIKSAETEESVA